MMHKIEKHFFKWETAHFPKQIFGFKKCEIVSLIRMFTCVPAQTGEAFQPAGLSKQLLACFLL